MPESSSREGVASGGGAFRGGGVCFRGEGVCFPGGLCFWGVVCFRGCVFPGDGIPACTEADILPVNRMTDRCKNITLATTSLRPVITSNESKLNHFSPSAETVCVFVEFLLESVVKSIVITISICFESSYSFYENKSVI